MIVLLYGADELAIRRRIQQLKEQADAGTGMLITNLAEFDGRDVKAADILAPANSIPFLAPHRLIVVEHFFERFESRGGPNTESPGARRLAAFEPLLEALRAGLPASTILVFTGVSDDRQPFSGNPMLKALKEIPGVEDAAFPPLQGKQISAYIQGEANARSLRFRSGRASLAELRPGEEPPRETDPADLLANLLQGDTLAIANELDKLALYSQGREMGVAEVNRVTAGDRETTTFAFVDAVMDGELGVAMQRLEWLLRDGAERQGLVSSLLIGYRRSATILDLLEDGATAEEIGRALGPAGRWPGLRDAAIRRARKAGQSGLQHAYEAIAESERAFKTGETEEDVAFDLLLMRLAGLVGDAPKRPLVPLL